MKKVSLPDIVGRGYGTFWNFKGRYRVVKGSRASKKSKTTALWFIVALMKYPDANALVIRKVERTLRDSCFADLKWAIHRLGVDAFFDCKISPLEIVYKPTGQKILFRGLDDGFKITSISVEKGYLCFVWIEEAYEIMSEEMFDTLDESIRGAVPEGLFKQITLSFNPWNEHHWLKHRFFDELVGHDDMGKPLYVTRDKPISDDGNILAMTTNYTCNEWLDDSDKKLFETMKKNNPRRYRVAGLGEWGMVDGLVYENWEEANFDAKEIAKRPNVKSAFGLDFGYTNDPSALVCSLIDEKKKEIYVFDEMYKKGLTNRMIYDEIVSMGYAKEKIIADSAEPKSITELRDLGLYRVHAARKGKDSILNGIQFIQNYKIYIHPKCVNFLTEISNYVWDKDKFGNTLNKPIDDFNHGLDAWRYSLEGFVLGDTFSFD